MPVVGYYAGKIGEARFEQVVMWSLMLVASTHFCFLVLPYETMLGSGFWAVAPLVPFGLGHAIYVTMLGPIMPKILGEEHKDQLTMCLSIMKIIEGLWITIVTYLFGSLRMRYGNYNLVIFLELLCALGAAACSYMLIPSQTTETSRME